MSGFSGYASQKKPSTSSAAGASEDKKSTGISYASPAPKETDTGSLNMSPLLQRMASGATAQLAGMEEELPKQGKFVMQKVGGPEEELPKQGKFMPMQMQGAEEEEKQLKKAPSGGIAQLEQGEKTANNTGMPDNLKSGLENMSGMDLSDVKVHYNSDKPAQLNALAYAQGSDIHVGPGQEQHLPHEGWHVVQQRQGRVQATMQMKEGVPVNDDPGLEHEADVMGAKAVAQGRMMKK